MPLPQDSVRTYRQLAEEHHRLNRPQERDRFLLLAADAALAAGQTDEAERLRKSLLRENPNHLIRSYGTMAEALKSQDIQAYLQQLRRSFPPEKGETLLATLKGDGGSGVGPDRTGTVKTGTLATRSIVVKPGDRNKFLAKPPEVPALKPTPAPAPPVERIAPIPLQPLPDRPKAQPLPRRALPEPSARTSATDDTAGGAWISTLLFVVGLVAALSTLGWALGRPFIK